MNQTTFQAIGWFIGALVSLALAVALAVSAKRTDDDIDRSMLSTVASVVVFLAALLFGFGWYSMSVGLFGGTK